MALGPRLAALTALCALALTPIVCAAADPAVGPDRAVTVDEGNECVDNPTKINEAPPALPLMQADLANDLSTGAGVLVAVVDSGVNGKDPRLAQRIAGGVNLVPDGTDTRGLTDRDGHGTAIAGIIAAAPSDGSGVRGLAPDARIFSVRVYSTTEQQDVDNGNGPSAARIAAGIRAATDAGAKIINVSMSTPYSFVELDDAVAYARDHGSLVVASSGNVTEPNRSVGEDGADDGPRFPAGSPGALGVAAASVPGGAVTDDSRHGPHVSIIAPGQTILTLAPTGGDCVYGQAPASSFATAYVSAAAALVASRYPDESPDEWAFRLTASALRGNPDQRDDRSGWGLVQPFEALTLVPGPETRGPANPFLGGATLAPPTFDDAVTIRPGSDQPARDREQMLMVGTIAVAVLCLSGALGVYRAARRRASR